MLALFLGLIVSAGLYFAYLWPTVEPLDEPAARAADSAPAAESADRDSDHDDGDADREDAKPGTPEPAPDEASPSTAS